MLDIPTRYYLGPLTVTKDSKNKKSHKQAGSIVTITKPLNDKYGTRQPLSQGVGKDRAGKG